MENHLQSWTKQREHFLAVILKMILKICKRFSTSHYGTLAQGTDFEYKLFLQRDSTKISFWHDVPLRAGEDFNMGIEIPR